MVFRFVNKGKIWLWSMLLFFHHSIAWFVCDLMRTGLEFPTIPSKLHLQLRSPIYSEIGRVAMRHQSQSFYWQNHNIKKIEYWISCGEDFMSLRKRLQMLTANIEHYNALTHSRQFLAKICTKSTCQHASINWNSCCGNVGVYGIWKSIFKGNNYEKVH